MAIYYSASLRGFFDPQIHQPLPADAVKITARRHADLLAAQEQGAQIVPDDQGRPVIQEPPADQLRAALTRDIKREARRRIDAISPAWRQLNDLREPGAEGAARFAQIDAVRAASALIEQQLAATPAKALTRFPVRENPLWPQLDDPKAAS